MELEPLRLEEVEQAAEQPQFVVVAQLATSARLRRAGRVSSETIDEPPIGARQDRAARPQADRGIQRLRAVRGTGRAARCRACRRPDRSASARTRRCARGNYSHESNAFRLIMAPSGQLGAGVTHRRIRGSDYGRSHRRASAQHVSFGRCRAAARDCSTIATATGSSAKSRSWRAAFAASSPRTCDPRSSTPSWIRCRSSVARSTARPAFTTMEGQLALSLTADAQRTNRGSPARRSTSQAARTDWHSDFDVEDAACRRCLVRWSLLATFPVVGTPEACHVTVAIIRHMSLRDIRRHVGQLAIAGFAADSIPSDLRLLAREFDLGGVILFARNVATPEQVADCRARGADAGRRAAAVGQRRPGRRPGRAAARPRSPSGRR